MNLNQVTLPATNLDQSVAFYRRMGFKQIVGSPHYARFECPAGEATFTLHLAPPASQPSGVVVYFETPELDAEVRRLQAAGFEFIQTPRDEPWLWREARLNDPSGNVLCLFWAGEARMAINPAQSQGVDFVQGLEFGRGIPPAVREVAEFLQFGRVGVGIHGLGLDVDRAKPQLEQR